MRNEATATPQVVRGNKSELRKALGFLGAAIAARAPGVGPDDPMLRAWLARMTRWQEELRNDVLTQAS